MEYECILLAAGEGQRAALGYNKVLYKINGKKELVLYSLEYFMKDKNCKKIVLVINKNDRLYFKNMIRDDKVSFAIGGSTRGDSVEAGLKLIDSEYVIVHDGARPLVYVEDIRNLCNAAEETGGATLATKVYNTTCRIKDGYVDEYFSRHTLASVITPQCYNTAFLMKAYEEANKEGISFTDDSSLFNKYSNQVKIVWTQNVSIKATTIYDIRMLEGILG